MPTPPNCSPSVIPRSQTTDVSSSPKRSPSELTDDALPPARRSCASPHRRRARRYHRRCYRRQVVEDRGRRRGERWRVDIAELASGLDLSGESAYDDQRRSRSARVEWVHGRHANPESVLTLQRTQARVRWSRRRSSWSPALRQANQSGHPCRAGRAELAASRSAPLISGPAATTRAIVRPGTRRRALHCARTVAATSAQRLAHSVVRSSLVGVTPRFLLETHC